MSKYVVTEVDRTSIHLVFIALPPPGFYGTRHNAIYTDIRG
ncbi:MULTISPECIES: hypothetical protein [Terasakiella]|nr:hypothetical protein [Terasakiella brassicae]